MEMSPDELINEIKPWNPESWREFVEDYVVPIKLLAETISDLCVGDPASEPSKFLAVNAEKVIETSKRFLGDVKVEFEVPADPVECLRLLVEKCGNSFLGVDNAGKYTLFAWTLRKVSREYMLEALYPTLKDEEKQRKTFEILGIRELFIPAIKSELARNWIIFGYHDYPSMFKVEKWGYTLILSVLPFKEPTFGGSICRFVDCLVAILSRPGVLSSVEISADVVKNYLDRCPQKPSELYPIDRLDGRIGWSELDWKKSYSSLSEGFKWEIKGAWIISGFALRCAKDLSADKLEKPDPHYVIKETNLLSFLRDLMPSLIAGRTEILLNENKKIAVLFERRI
jgi:hypothetical protein